MNTNQLKKFAQESRRKLIGQVTAKLNYVLKTDSAELREKGAAVNKLKEALKETSKEKLIDKVAYTWFNRFVALRFMDVNDYQPIGIQVLSPVDGFTIPEILVEAKKGSIHDELQVDRRKIGDLLDGRIPNSNPQNEVYKLLLTGVCNHLHKTFPFLFERIDDYTELLLPDDLTSEYSIIQDIINGMDKEDCKEVEIIGWLYQFYISEWNEELISSKKKYKKEELAPASQLFTPRWIVEYMVDNTLGQLWTEISPNTKVSKSLQYYIQPSYSIQRERKSVEEIKFFEPCVGSGHILSYAFDVFFKIYQEEGYNQSEIPELILTKNLFGIDIDQRAAQLASFVLMMKAREKSRRFFRKEVMPNISYYQDFEFDEKFKHATALGSLIKVDFSEYESFQVDENSLFGERQKELKKLYRLLGQRYDVVVTNPPYINSSRMEDKLKEYVQKKYPETKTDLFATFILRCLELCNEDGLTGYMTPFVWMFISSYEKLREELISNHFINNLIQLEYSGFDGATVPICTFTLRNKSLKGEKGNYIRLSDFKGAKVQSPKTLEAIQNRKCGWFYNADQKDFSKILGSPIGYFLSTQAISIFKDSLSLNKVSKIKKGISTGNNARFLRFWTEVQSKNISKSANPLGEKLKWIRANKGGEFQKYYGNIEYVVNWENDGDELNSFKPSSVIRSREYFFREILAFSKISSSNFSIRKFPEGFISIDASSYLVDFQDIRYLLGVLNSKVFTELLGKLTPTLNFEIGDLAKFPIPTDNNLGTKEIIYRLVDENLKFSISYEECKERSLNYKSNSLFLHSSHEIQESYDLYKQFWTNKFFQLHRNEEDLNYQFIQIYGLQDELTPDVSLEDITILKEETSIVNGELVFDQKEVFSQFISYAVGCMFGRYSLDKEGLILANQGETLQDYLSKIQKQEAELSFVPDEDNVIPILDDEWFEDDIVGRFHEFLRASFGNQNFEKNLSFVEESIGKDIRKYFVKDFYKDHIQRYKKRPIYWMFSSPKGSFNVLVYMHRYTSDTLNQILNGYLNEYREKLKTRMETLDHLMISGTPSEQNKASKEKDKIQLVLLELQEYEREVLYPLATERISIDLDDGVLVNYNKFGKAIAPVAGLNDKKTKEKVMEFDWIDTTTIR